MENKTNKIKNWFSGLFQKRYIDLGITNQIKKNGIIPVFFFFKINHFRGVLKNPLASF